MLKTRIITAAVLLPLAFALIFAVPPAAFAWAAALLLLVGCWEFRRLAAVERGAAGWALPVLQALIYAGLALAWQHWASAPASLFVAACLAWLLMLLQLYFYRPGSGPERVFRIRGFFNALVVLTSAWMALAWLRHEPAGEWWILLLLLIIWAADVGAYFTGRALGRRKLAPHISPGKTVAGFTGGITLAVVVAVCTAALVPRLPVEPLPIAAIALVTAVVSVGGDLFISMHKRTVGCKDTGRIFPGHGGVLDRLDSLIAGAPFFGLGKLLAGI